MFSLSLVWTIPWEKQLPVISDAIYATIERLCNVGVNRHKDYHLVIIPQSVWFSYVLFLTRWYPHDLHHTTDKTRQVGLHIGRVSYTVGQQLYGLLTAIPLSSPCGHFKGPALCIHSNATNISVKVSHIVRAQGNAPIPQCTDPIAHNAPFCDRNVHRCAHLCYKMVHCGIFV